MKDASHKNPNYKNEIKFPHSKKVEPTSPHELKKLLMTARSQRDEAWDERDEWQNKAKENQEAATQLVHVQQNLQTFQFEVHEWKGRATQNHQLYLDEQQRYQQTLCLYNEEKVRATEFLAKYEEANAQRVQYLTLYSEAQAQLKYERRSKAGIKGWESRRKRESERLKQEISEMTILLRDSLARKDEAVNNLYILAERMDRIQQLVDSVEGESTSTPVGLLQKLRRIWLTIKEILAE